MKRVRIRPPAWSQADTAILDDVYPREGLAGVADLLPHRSHHAIQQRAHKRGLRSPPVNRSPTPVLAGEALDKAILLHDAGWRMATIARELGYNESATTNAVLIAQCARMGYRPAERDSTGRLTPDSFERLRYMLKKGLKQVEIQLRLGVSASTVSRERRRYDADLANRGKAQLPPPGAGERYSGVRIPSARRREVEELLQKGFGAPTAARRAGVSVSAAKRIRTRLVAQLARKGGQLPGCDRAGRRMAAAMVSRHYIPRDQVDQMRLRLLAAEPVAHAARAVGIGRCSAYRIRDALAAELAERGEALSKPVRLGRGAAFRIRAAEADWLPPGRLQEFRALVHEHGAIDAKRMLLDRIADEKRAAAEARAAERARPKTFEEQLARIASGEAKLVANTPLRRPGPEMTLGGVASGAL